MNTKKMLVVIGFGIVIAAFIFFKLSNTPKYDNKLDMKTDCAFNNIDLFEINSLSDCSISDELALGIEVVFSFNDSREGKSRRFSLNVSSMSKRDILNEIIRKNPGYSWRVKDGVVNIQPARAGNNSRTVSPLDMTIPRFEVHQIPPGFALEYLRRLARQHDIQLTTGLYEIATHRGVKLPDPVKVDHPEAYDPRQLINVVIQHEVSIRDCLNAIILANPPAYWRAIKGHGGKTVLDLASSQQGYSREKNIDTTDSYKFP